MEDIRLHHPAKDSLDSSGIFGVLREKFEISKKNSLSGNEIFPHVLEGSKHSLERTFVFDKLAALLSLKMK